MERTDAPVYNSIVDCLMKREFCVVQSEERQRVGHKSMENRIDVAALGRRGGNTIRAIIPNAICMETAPSPCVMAPHPLY